MHGIEFNGIGSVWSSKISSRKHCYYYIVSNLILFLSMRHLIPSGSYIVAFYNIIINNSFSLKFNE
ncbi:hypothetical protein T4B_9977 [Trichinella pseudospiralis]|uniref:Uncharacterized protein n=1 Tax=Trichinella pseudospiralis TaxID=6337 RepID=A0A0V1JFD0_TRIPS|nr:hypothetical protein T4B_9977 [Trichinella pseudospiralis]